MADILYVYGGSLYVNLTNHCPCNCTFCIRSHHDGLGTAQSLWLEEDPTSDEIIAAFRDYDLSQYGEVIFCGYGEPFCALESLLAVSRFLKEKGVKTRVNTNGLGDLINHKKTAPLLKGLIDTISISLNAPDEESYIRVTQPSFGKEAFGSMLDFAVQCKEYVPVVKFTVVDVIPEAEIEACKQLANRLGIPLRVRNFQ